MNAQPLNRPCGVDVLAWIDLATTGLHCLCKDSPAANRGAEVKRAVAELIEAAGHVVAAYENDMGWEDKRAARLDLKAALAAVEGKS
jgi:hypothetical protein